MNPPKLLTPPELQALRARSARGIPLTLEEVASFVLSTRRSFLALPPTKKEAVAKSKAEKAAEKTMNDAQIDFF